MAFRLFGFVGKYYSHGRDGFRRTYYNVCALRALLLRILTRKHSCGSVRVILDRIVTRHDNVASTHQTCRFLAVDQ